jgi:hypothetical protein
MLLGGLWHGANWTFVAWGALHGFYLLVNHAWRSLRERLGWTRTFGRPGALLAVLLTFTATVVAWVFFRADTMDRALAILHAMTGANGMTLPYRWADKLGAAGAWLARHGVRFENTGTFGGGPQLNWLIACALIVWLAPNTQQILRAFRPALGVEPDGHSAWWQWRPAWPWLAATSVIAALAVLSLTEVSEFIYFQF